MIELRLFRKIDRWVELDELMAYVSFAKKVAFQLWSDSNVVTDVTSWYDFCRQIKLNIFFYWRMEDEAHVHSRKINIFIN